MNKIRAFINKPNIILLHWNAKGYFNHLPDSIVVPLLWRGVFGQKLNLKNPTTFNEKLQWLKLYDQNPMHTLMADKCEAKKVIAELVGEEYVIPTLGVWDSFDEIDFSSLPNQFVLKTTHDSGGVFICNDKNTFDVEKARKKLEPRLKQSYYLRNREWVYKDIKPRIIAEQFMEDASTGELRDYKFYCFDGIVKALLLATNRQSKTDELRFDYFDREFHHMKLTNHWHPNAVVTPSKPVQFEKMVELAERISKGFPHLRIDFYEANGKIFVGEFTFYDMAGYLQIHPDEWETEWGNLINLKLAYNYEEWKQKNEK